MNLSDTFQSFTQREKVLVGVLGIVVLIIGSVYFFSMLSAEKNINSQVVIPPPVPDQQAGPVQITIKNNLKTANIKNPFQIPSQYQVRKETAPSAPRGLSTPKSVSSIPELRGIIASGSVKMAIFEQGGDSDTFGIGDTLGGYTIVSITDTQVVLNGPEGRQVLDIGR